MNYAFKKILVALGCPGWSQIPVVLVGFPSDISTKFWLPLVVLVGATILLAWFEYLSYEF